MNPSEMLTNDPQQRKNDAQLSAQDAFVKEMSGTTYEQTAGSRHWDASPLPREAQQLREEAGAGAKQQAQQAEQSDKPAKAADGHGKRNSIADKLHLPYLHDKRDGAGEKRKSISDSGPFIVVQDPETGHAITKPNPHWPEEDSWKREKVRSGKGDSNVIAPGGMDLNGGLY